MTVVVLETGVSWRWVGVGAYFPLCCDRGKRTSGFHQEDEQLIFFSCFCSFAEKNEYNAFAMIFFRQM